MQLQLVRRKEPTALTVSGGQEVHVVLFGDAAISEAERYVLAKHGSHFTAPLRVAKVPG
jgi:hypothetical protein